MGPQKWVTRLDQFRAPIKFQDNIMQESVAKMVHNSCAMLTDVSPIAMFPWIFPWIFPQFSPIFTSVPAIFPCSLGNSQDLPNQNRPIFPCGRLLMATTRSIVVFAGTSARICTFGGSCSESLARARSGGSIRTGHEVGEVGGKMMGKLVTI